MASPPPSASASFGSAAASMAAAAVAAVATEDLRVAEVQRAAEYVRTQQERMRAASEIKDRLSMVARALGSVLAVVPGGEPVRHEADALLLRLEGLSPTDKPLNTGADDRVARTAHPTGPPPPSPDINLLGEWRLEYASNGPASGSPLPPSSTASASANLLAHLLQFAGSIPGFGMDGVIQRLWTDPGRRGVILVENSATFRLGLLGSWKVTARGGWRDNGGGMCAQAWFESFAVRPVGRILGFDASTLPEVVVPVPAQLQMLSDWCTTYLDGDTRVSRGAGGLIFLFKKVNGGTVDMDRILARPTSPVLVMA
jgi:hypothetical protein